MPATDGLQPPLSEAERKVCKSYGGWTSFMASMRLRPWNDDDAAEGKAIIAGLANELEEVDTVASETNQTTDGAAEDSKGGQSSNK